MNDLWVIFYFNKFSRMLNRDWCLMSQLELNSRPKRNEPNVHRMIYANISKRNRRQNSFSSSHKSFVSLNYLRSKLQIIIGLCVILCIQFKGFFSAWIEINRILVPSKNQIVSILYETKKKLEQFFLRLYFECQTSTKDLKSARMMTTTTKRVLNN